MYMNTSDIKSYCEANSEISKVVIDNFLISYAASNNNLEEKMNVDFGKYRHITSILGKESTNMLKSQYLAHKIFNYDGSISRYLKHKRILELPEDIQLYLKRQSEIPWHFTFSIIISNPEDMVYEMEDVFTGEIFYLYSPGIKAIVKSRPVSLWFNLIAFNGRCWQSYGPIAGYSSFEADDIFFFATELDNSIADEMELVRYVDSNPLPFMMLISGSEYPRLFHKEDLVIHAFAEYSVNLTSQNILKNDFKIEHNASKGIYRFSLKYWSGYPHYSTAYYDEKKKMMILSAMTDRGFYKLVRCLREYGYDFEEEPFVRASAGMTVTAGDILGRQVIINEYAKFFEKPKSEESKKGLEKMNKVLDLTIPYINKGIYPDVSKVAEQAGMDLESVKLIIEHVWKKVKR
jgi:hypothetical protein